MTDIEVLKNRVRQLEDEREPMREALVTALGLQAISLQLLGRDHPYAGKQIARGREIAADVAGMLRPGGWEDLKLASQLIQ